MHEGRAHSRAILFDLLSCALSGEAARDSRDFKLNMSYKLNAVVSQLSIVPHGTVNKVIYHRPYTNSAKDREFYRGAFRGPE